MAAETRSVVVRLSLENAQYLAAALESGVAMERGMGRAEAATRKVDAAQAQLAGTAKTTALVTVGALVAMGKAAVDWESQWAGVTKTVSGSTAELDQLEGQLRDIATTLPASHKEIAGVAEAAGQLGVARQDIASFTTTMINLGETTNLTADQAATDIAQIQNVMRTAPADVDNLGAALVDLGNNGASTEAQILSMSQRIAAAGAQIGLAESDILGIANAAASMGLEVEAGGTAISRVFTEIAKATTTGNDKLTTFAQTAGMTREEFQQLFGNDPARAFAAFVEGLDRVNKSGGDVFTTLDQIGLSDVRVSQALLSMASAGGYLTDSLDRSALAWEQNTALTAEAEKRYATTASEIQVAWNRIRDAGIDAGEAILPVVASIAEVVGGLADAFNSLPAPVQGALTGMLAITAVFSSGLWFTSKVIGGIQTTRSSLATLQATGSRTATVLGNIGRRAAGLAAVAVAMNAISQAISDAAQINSQDIGRDLDALTRGEINDSVDKLISSLGKLDHSGDNIKEGFQNVFSLWGTVGDATWETASKNIDKVDQQLASMVESGQQAAASDIFEAIASQAEEAGYSTEFLSGEFDSYKTALENAEAASVASTDATSTLSAAQLAAAESARQQAQAVHDAVDEMRRQREEALRSVDAQLNWEESLLDARDAVRENGRALARNGDLLDGHRRKGIAAKRALVDLASAWNGLSDQAKNAPGAYRGAINSFVDLATQMGMGEDQARRLAKRLLEVPTRVETKAYFDSTGASSSINAFTERLNRLDGKSATTYVVTKYSTIRSGEVATRKADGGLLRGPGGPRDDRIPVLASNGEFIVNAAATSRNLALLHHINAKRFADGGQVGSTAASAVFDSSRTAGSLDDLARAGADASRALREETQQRRNNFQQARADLSGNVAEGFRSDPFATASVWTNSDPLAVLRTDIANARRYSRLVGRLRGRGLDGGALASVTGLDQAGALAGMSRGQLREYERLYRVRQRVTAQAGDRLAAGAIGGGDSARLGSIDRRLQSIDKKLGEAPERTGEAFGRELKTATAQGINRARRGGM